MLKVVGPVSGIKKLIKSCLKKCILLIVNDLMVENINFKSPNAQYVRKFRQNPWSMQTFCPRIGE